MKTTKIAVFVMSLTLLRYIPKESDDVSYLLIAHTVFLMSLLPDLFTQTVMTKSKPRKIIGVILSVTSIHLILTTMWHVNDVVLIQDVSYEGYLCISTTIYIAIFITTITFSELRKIKEKAPEKENKGKDPSGVNAALNELDTLSVMVVVDTDPDAIDSGCSVVKVDDSTYRSWHQSEHSSYSSSDCGPSD